MALQQVLEIFLLQIQAQFSAICNGMLITESAVSSKVMDKPRAELHLHTPFKL
jgi:hypothetical protein